MSQSHDRVDWNTGRIGDMPITIIDGDRSAKYPKRDEFQPEGVLFLNTTNITDDRLDLTSANFICAEKYATITKGRLQPLDVVVTTRGSIGKVALYNRQGKGLINAQMLILRADGKTIDSKFLFHVVRSNEFQQKLRNFSSGSAQPQIPIIDLRAVTITYPDVHTQRSIADILSAYDNLIENNTRRIKVLEQTARMLYREWFVNFRFPGHEKVKVVESGKGLLPQGWTTQSIKDIASFISRGIAPAYDDAAEGLVINQKCIRDGKLSLTLARRQSKEAPEEKMVREGDVLINSTGVGTLGRVAQVLEPITNCTVDSHVSIVRPRQYSEFFGRTLIELEDYFTAQGVGSTGQTELSRERIGATQIVMPPATLQEKFCRVVAPMNKMLLCCLKRNTNLRTTRDMLLPKLVSGEVSVEQIEKEAVAHMV